MAYIFVVFVAFVQGFFFLTHWFVYKTMVKFLVIHNHAAVTSLSWGFGIMSVSFLAAFLLTFRYYNFFTRIFYTLAAGWLGLFFFLLLASIMIWVLHFLPVDSRLVAQVLLVLAILFAAYSFINASLVKVTTITVRLPNLPAAWQNRTAVWVSDTHLGQVRNYGFAKNIADKITRLHPDIIFIGGDLYDGVTVDTSKVIEPLSRLKAPLGVYFITGNHEEFGDETKYLEAIRNAGITVLDDQMLNLDGVQLIGVDYRDSSNALVYKDVLAGLNINVNQPSILLKHEPNNLQIAQQAGINFQISGHTHRAQAWPFSYIPASYYKGYDYGLKMFGQMQVYTSSGAGTWGPPIRFGTSPEIVQIKFE
jgi:uncharacterized protein